MTDTDLDLRQLFRDQIKDHPGPITKEWLADTVITKIPTEQRDTALRVALTHMARDIIIQDRPATPPAPAVTSTKSWKRDAIRAQEAARRTELDARYATKDGFKRLGAFTHDELVALADSLKSLAEANLAKSARVRSFADAVAAAGVDTLDDLGAESLHDLGIAA